MGMPSRNGTATRLGVPVSRLRSLELTGSLPTWGSIESNDYFWAARMMILARDGGMTQQQITAACYAIRDTPDVAELNDATQAAHDDHEEYIRAELARVRAESERGKK